MDEYVDVHLDSYEEVEEDETRDLGVGNKSGGTFLETIGSMKVIHLKRNYIPKGISPIKICFDLDEVPTKPSMKPKPFEVKVYNLMSLAYPKIIKLSKNLTQSKK